MLAGERMTAKDLEYAGLISKIIPRERFMEDVMAIGRRIAAMPARSRMINKQRITGFFEEQLEKANEMEKKVFGGLLETDARRIAVGMFSKEQALEKAKKDRGLQKL